TVYVTDDQQEAEAARHGGINSVVMIDPEAPDFKEVYNAIAALQDADIRMNCTRAESIGIPHG
ncbi:MAG TPA: hypothetical protein VJK52_01105, partial [Candidatus Nanoarchaeia archaeon]|nr:hypothetical protein [Candidatus Nanoarchaeia archaeon]